MDSLVAQSCASCRMFGLGFGLAFLLPFLFGASADESSAAYHKENRGFGLRFQIVKCRPRYALSRAKFIDGECLSFLVHRSILLITGGIRVPTAVQDHAELFGTFLTGKIQRRFFRGRLCIRRRWLTHSKSVVWAMQKSLAVSSIA